jgi:hypothetical protein
MIGRETLRVALCLLCVFLAAGCRPKGPDANYEKAAKIYQQLYATELDDAYGDPKMAEVEALLKKVDKRSIDHDAAQAMLHSIERGREELAKSRADREKMGAAAAASARSGSPNIDVAKILAASATVEDAGTPPDPYAAGSSVAEINTATGGCLADAEQFTEQVTGVTGTVYRLAKAPACAEKLPGFVGQVVLVKDGRIYRRMPDPGPLTPPSPPDAGAPAPAPTPPAAAAPADAGGAPQALSYYPGMPTPGTEAPDAG